MPSARMKKSAEPLTPREKEVLRLIGFGTTSKEIAQQLKISVFTVGNHRRSLCKKLDVHSTAALVALASGK